MTGEGQMIANTVSHYPSCQHHHGRKTSRQPATHLPVWIGVQGATRGGYKSPPMQNLHENILSF